MYFLFLIHYTPGCWPGHMIWSLVMGMCVKSAPWSWHQTTAEENLLLSWWGLQWLSICSLNFFWSAGKFSFRQVHTLMPVVGFPFIYSVKETGRNKLILITIIPQNAHFRKKDNKMKDIQKNPTILFNFRLSIQKMGLVTEELILFILKFNNLKT